MGRTVNAPTDPLTLGISPCPNDTFAFHALLHGLVDSPRQLEVRMHDVEALNRAAGRGELDVTKVSCAVLPRLSDRYVVLRSGGALGRGCGPLLVARRGTRLENLRGARIAVPGRDTTANLLLHLFGGGLPEPEELFYSEIPHAVASGVYDAGVIIHESRFTYRELGLDRLVDLGEWWEADTELPIPLGAIVARRELGTPLLRDLEAAITASVRYARRHPDASAAYVERHAQEMDPSVISRHIGLYVNDYTERVGAEGERALRELMRRAGAPEAGLFADQ
jgi:1,4-dihydroxy-6-naphthoate synthase